MKDEREEEPMMSVREPRPMRRRRIAALIIGILVLIALGKIAWILKDGSKWRAVFLANNQVYFGKFVNWPFASSISLHDIYYLQVNQPIQPQGGSGSAQNPEISVVKLGNELHGPEDLMVIPSHEILYWENLKPSGSLVQTIQKFQAEHK